MNVFTSFLACLRHIGRDEADKFTQLPDAPDKDEDEQSGLHQVVQCRRSIFELIWQKRHLVVTNEQEYTPEDPLFNLKNYGRFAMACIERLLDMSQSYLSLSVFSLQFQKRHAMLMPLVCFTGKFQRLSHGMQPTPFYIIGPITDHLHQIPLPRYKV